MALVVKDRVKETSTTTGTTDFVLAGAASGFQAFSTVGNGNTTYYCAVLNTEWEVGIGTYSTTGPTLARTTILASSNSGSKVTFSAGTKTIFCDYPAGTAVDTAIAQTLTNKTVEAGTFTNGYTEEVGTANTSTAYTIDLANGSIQNLTLTGTCTYTFPTATAGRSFLLIQKQDGTGNRTVTWPAAVKWPSSTAPTLTATASKADVFAFTADGTNWYGRTIGQLYL